MTDAELIDYLKDSHKFTSSQTVRVALDAAADLITAQAERIKALEAGLRIAEAALADIGDAEREEGDDLAWCEARAAKALPLIRPLLRAALSGTGEDR